MRLIERALSQLVNGSAEGLCPALASFGDRFGFQRVGHRRMRACCPTASSAVDLAQSQPGSQPGTMFWFMRKTFSGSYRRFTIWSRR
jgi:hypothetical protein